MCELVAASANDGDDDGKRKEEETTLGTKIKLRERKQHGLIPTIDGDTESVRTRKA